MKNIILLCVNLCRLDIMVDWFYDHQYVMKFEYVLNDFLNLQTDGIVRQRVSHFSLWLNYQSDEPVELRNTKFRSFFTVFPSIKKLDLRMDISYDDQVCTTRFTFSFIYYQLNEMRHQLEKLTLILGAGESRISEENLLKKFKQISLIEKKRLKTLFLYWIDGSDDSFLHMKHLTKLQCEIDISILGQKSGSDFVQRILSTAKELRYLTLDFLSPLFHLSKDCFEALMRSKLIFLQFDVNVTTKFGLKSINQPPNHTLECLHFLEGCEFDKLLFATYFHGLRILDVSKIDDNISNILRYQTKLCCLAIDGSSSENSVAVQRWLRNEDGLAGEFNYLTDLRLIEDESLDLSKFILSKFRFPKLKTLAVNFVISRKSSYDSYCNFWSCIQKLTELEFLLIQWGVEISSEQLSLLCNTLIKLRFFIYLSEFVAPFEIETYHQIFHQCSSLRMIVHGGLLESDSYSAKYFKDISTNTVRNLPCPLEELNLKEYSCIYEGIPSRHL